MTTPRATAMSRALADAKKHGSGTLSGRILGHAETAMSTVGKASGFMSVASWVVPAASAFTLAMPASLALTASAYLASLAAQKLQSRSAAERARIDGMIADILAQYVAEFHPELDEANRLEFVRANAKVCGAVAAGKRSLDDLAAALGDEAPLPPDTLGEMAGFCEGRKPAKQPMKQVEEAQVNTTRVKVKAKVKKTRAKAKAKATQSPRRKRSLRKRSVKKL